MSMPLGVRVTALASHPDERGDFTELHRLEWETEVAPVQWNAVRSAARVLRGVHVHVRHDDYLVVFEGAATVGLADLREDSPTFGATSRLLMGRDNPIGITIPHGVAHGFLFHERSLHIYAVSHYWDVADELGCRWDDPELGIEWPDVDPLLSDRDAALPSLAELRPRLREAWAAVSAR
jgi:dTDP-4-dehydrorhamnose 3,5-epimerase